MGLSKMLFCKNYDHKKNPKNNYCGFFFFSKNILNTLFKKFGGLFIFLKIFLKIRYFGPFSEFFKIIWDFF